MSGLSFPLFVAVLTTLTFAPFWLPPFLEYSKLWIGTGARQRRDVRRFNNIRVDMVCAMLREGRGWECDGYRANHRGIGVSLWVANGVFGLGVRFDGREAGPMEGKLSKRQRRRILNAYEERGEDAKSAAAQLEEFMERVRKYQDDMA